MVDTGRKNKGKQGIDISDQMASYFTALRKTIRWYHKIGLEFLLNTAVVNALSFSMKYAVPKKHKFPNLDMILYNPWQV